MIQMPWLGGAPGDFGLDAQAGTGGATDYYAPMELGWLPQYPQMPPCPWGESPPHPRHHPHHRHHHGHHGGQHLPGAGDWPGMSAPFPSGYMPAYWDLPPGMAHIM
jgi:hypothetical protein